MHFKDALWDDSDPLYAPGLKKIRNHYAWVAGRRYRDAGYQLKTMNLGGAVGDGQDVQRAARCRELTREMVAWFEGKQEGRQAGTWGWLISRYLHDEYSAINDVRPSTRESYKKVLKRIEAAIGSVLIEDTDYPRLMEWRRAMEAKGRSPHYVNQWFRHWGLVNSHGIKLELPRCRELKAVRSEMRIKSPSKRSAFLNRQQVEAIVERLDECGFQYVSLALLMRFEFMLRGIDVYGDWTPTDARQGGIQVGERMWEGGLTWEMIDTEVTHFNKVISKTRDSLPEPYRFDLMAVPQIRDRLLAIPEAERVGPVIKTPGKKTPPMRGVISRRFKKALRDCKLPDELQIRDARSGGITEAKSLAQPFQLRDAAQHTQITTTNSYVRDRSTSANEVIELRQKGRK